MVHSIYCSTKHERTKLSHVCFRRGATDYRSTKSSRYRLQMEAPEELESGGDGDAPNAGGEESSA